MRKSFDWKSAGLHGIAFSSGAPTFVVTHNFFKNIASDGWWSRSFATTLALSSAKFMSSTAKAKLRTANIQWAGLASRSCILSTFSKRRALALAFISTVSRAFKSVCYNQTLLTISTKTAFAATRAIGTRPGLITGIVISWMQRQVCVRLICKDVMREARGQLGMSGWPRCIGEAKQKNGY